MSDLNDPTPLGPLDPGSSDPGFWVRFHSAVMDQARAELARRRLEAEPTVAEVVFAWRRALVPAALLAAGLAALLLAGHEEAPAPLPPVALEEALIRDVPGESIPTVLDREAELDEVAFLTSMERF